MGMGFDTQLNTRLETAYEAYVLYIAKVIVDLNDHLEGEELIDKTADVLDEFAKAATMYSEIEKIWTERR